MKDELISEICNQLNITGNSATDSLCKAIYSATGKMALASLWDNPEDEGFVSIQHFKKRISEILTAYLFIFPEASPYFFSNRDVLVENIYTIYRRNGFFYHAAHRISPAVAGAGREGQCVLYRGVSPSKQCYMSGLGLYGVTKDVEARQSVGDVFNMQKQSLSDYLQEVIASGHWHQVEWPEGTRFLRMQSPFSLGYWQDKPDTDVAISMACYGMPKKLYVFYRWFNGHFEQKAIPAWRLDDFRSIALPCYGEYRRIACGLLHTVKQLPPVTATASKNNTVVITLGYRLPPAEEDFFNLYSWPMTFDFTQKTQPIFQREMSNIVYPVFKQHLMSIGFSIVEE